MFKITKEGRTIVGNNEDNWRTDPYIRFIPGTKNKYGIALPCSRSKDIPEGGVNEKGLCYDAFSILHRSNIPAKDPSKKDFWYSQLPEILKTCANVDEVQGFLSQFNLNLLNGSPLFHGGMLLFVDASGHYLSVEADAMVKGKLDVFLLANTSVAHASKAKHFEIERYRKGKAFVKSHTWVANRDYAQQLAQTMSVNRPKIGDGTTYTSIYDLQNGTIDLYFYHNFKHRVTFNLQKELQKEERTLDMVSLFPKNKQFEAFLRFQTPQNNQKISLFLFASLLLFLLGALSFFYRGVFYKQNKLPHLKRTDYLFMASFLFFLVLYQIQLLSNQGVFYFPAPYFDRPFSWFNLTSFIPYILPLFMVYFWFKFFKKPIKLSVWMNGLTTFIILCLFIQLGLYFYWGIY
jgi:hypothetical protein